MSPPLSPAVQKLIAAFGRELPARCQRLASALPSSADPATLKAYGDEVHKLAGSTGSYGFREVSEALRGLDQLIQDCLKGSQTWSAAQASAHLEAALAAVDNGPTSVADES